MNTKKAQAHVFEGRRRRPVLCEADVVVAGSGLSSTFAAIAAARAKARTVLVERMPTLGGNIGPAMVLNGSLYGEAEGTLPGGLAGLAKEFIDRLERHRVGPPRAYPEEASIASYVAYAMCREAGVTVFFSAYAADPIMKRRTVAGLFVEAKGGRVAIPARVVVDGTGDADIARRAGAPMVPYLPLTPGEGIDPRYKSAPGRQDLIQDGYMDRRFPTYWNDTEILCLVANVDLERYRRFVERPVRITPAVRRLAERSFHIWPEALWPALAKVWRDGKPPFAGQIAPDFRLPLQLGPVLDLNGVVGIRVLACGAIDAADPRTVALLEGEMRAQAFEKIEFMRRHAEGWERAWLLTTSAFLGFRGGPHIDGEHTLTPEEMYDGRKCDDALFRNIHAGLHGGDASGFDVPYGCTLPRKVEGLLVCGRGAAYLRRGHDPCPMRARPCMMALGQATGTAAALAARGGVAPRALDITKLQRRLVRDGLFLGDRARLRELGVR